MASQGAPVLVTAMGGSVILFVPRPTDYGGRPVTSYSVESGINIVSFNGVRAERVSGLSVSLHLTSISPLPSLWQLVGSLLS
jgi:hypothetical protein